MHSFLYIYIYKHKYLGVHFDILRITCIQIFWKRKNNEEMVDTSYHTDLNNARIIYDSGSQFSSSEYLLSTSLFWQRSIAYSNLKFLSFVIYYLWWKGGLATRENIARERWSTWDFERMRLPSASIPRSNKNSYEQ